MSHDPSADLYIQYHRHQYWGEDGPWVRGDERLVEPGTTVTFYGVRGSTPCHCSSMSRYGGNTACVVIESGHADPIVLDAGTGLRFYGLDRGPDPFTGTVLVTHLHWDHVQGLPFFSPLLDPESSTTIYGPPEPDISFGEAIAGFVKPPYFPVSIEQLPSSMSIKSITNERVDLGVGVSVMARPVPHNGETNGYRIDIGGTSIAYIPDHQEPAVMSDIADSVLELVEGVDLLIHDAQFTPELLATRQDWGHCTPEYALRVAEAGNAKRLALFHHDPLHNDDDVDRLVQQTTLAATSVAVLGAAEGLKISL